MRPTRPSHLARRPNAGAPAAAATLLAAALSLALPGLAGSQAAAIAKVRCPIKASSGASGPVQWAFTDSAPPSGGHAGISSSYTHGRGEWLGGSAKGTVCHSDLLSGGHGSRDLVLAVRGPAKLAPHTIQLGLLGVALTLKASVAASDDPACPVGTSATVALFASYFSVHRDSVRLRFAPPCAAHDHSFKGSALRVLITRKGAQVNSA